MRPILPLTMLVLLFITYNVYAGDPNCIPCIQDGGGTDYLNVTLLSAHTIDSLSGEIILRFEEYTTAEDPPAEILMFLLIEKTAPISLSPTAL